jgi:DNA adenine methylase
MAKTILELLPKDGNVYCEPYFWWGAIFWLKDWSAKCEIINDVNSNVTNFYRVMQTHFDELQKKIKGTLHARSEYKKAFLIYESPWLFDDPVLRARAFYVCCNQGYLHKVGSWGFDNQKATKVFANKVEKFEKNLAQKLRHTQIECNEAHKIIERADSKESVFYCDPPYTSDLGITVNQGHYKGYSHQDLERDLTVLSKIKGRFLLSNYPSDLLMEFVKKHNWYIKTFEKPLSASHKNKTEKRKKKTEVLIANYPI